MKYKCVVNYYAKDGHLTSKVWRADSFAEAYATVQLIAEGCLYITYVRIERL